MTNLSHGSPEALIAESSGGTLPPMKSMGSYELLLLRLVHLGKWLEHFVTACVQDPVC